MKNSFDVIIIGAGVVGCAIARELSKYRLRIALLEKESDVGIGTSFRNSGVVHAGFNCAPGTVKAGLCVEGCLEFESFCKELGVPYKKTGKLVVAFNDEDVDRLKKLKEIGDKNGVRDLSIISKEELRRKEPNIGGIAAMYSPWTAVTSPYVLTIALAENALSNGVKIFLDMTVKNIIKKPTGYKIETSNGEFNSQYVVNSAGLYSDKIAAMVGDKRYRIFPCRGEYFVLDKRLNGIINMPVYPVPRPELGGLGVHLTTTIDGNILIGPSAEYINKCDDYATTAEVMAQLYKEAKELLPLIGKKDVIRDYSGIRPKLVGKSAGGFGDFVIEESAQAKGFINLIGIESPGLTSAPTIAKRVASIMIEKNRLETNPEFKPIRKATLKFSELSDEEKAKLINEDPEYGEIVCRCEGITLREIKNAIENPLGVKTITGIKYRSRATMGRCQGGYCLTRIIDLLQKKYGISADKIMYAGEGSNMFSGKVK